MPSYKLGTAVKTDMAVYCKRILERQCKLALKNIPVTHEQFQASAIPDAKLLATLQDLDKQGVQGPIRQTEFPILIRAMNFPGLHRDMSVHINAPKPIFLARYARVTSRHGRGQPNVVSPHDRPIELDPKLFDAGQCEALVAWANNVVRVRRVMSMVMATVEDVLAHITTTGHIIARWPVLVGLVEDKKWQTKLRMKPERLGACGWPALDGNGQQMLTPDLLARMRASEPVLIMAGMLEDGKRAEGQTHADLWAYQSFESDRFNA